MNILEATILGVIQGLTEFLHTEAPTFMMIMLTIQQKLKKF